MRPFHGRPLMTHSPWVRSKTKVRGFAAFTTSASSAPKT